MLFIKKVLKRQNTKIFSLYFVIVNIIYFPNYFSYFQQDEWYFMSYFHQFPFSLFGAWSVFTAVFHDPIPFGFHLTPIGVISQWLEFSLFQINFPLYVLLSLTLHSIISYLLFSFVKRLTNNIHIAFFSGLFFAMSASHGQAVTWMSAHLPTQLACLFVLLSLNNFFDYLKIGNKKNYLKSILFFLISVLTKEIGVLLIVLLPILALIYPLKKYKFYKIKFLTQLKYMKLFYLSAIAYLTFRILTPSIIKAITHIEGLSGISDKSNNILFFLYYSFTFIFKVLSESFLALPLLNKFSEIVTDLGYPQYTAQKEVRGTEYLGFIQSAGIDIAMFLTGSIILILFIILYFNLSKNKYYKKAMIVGFSIIFLSILPLTFLAGWLMSFFSYISVIESRQLYISDIGISIFFGLALYIFYSKTREMNIYIVPLRNLYIIILFLWGLWNMSVILNDPSTDLRVAADRKEIVRLWLEDRDVLGKKTVFYSESNVALYGFGEYMLPFQNNPAQVIIGTYGYNQQFPNEFYQHKFLAKPITGEWYEEHEGVALGYYLNKKHLLQAISKYNIKPENIIALQYDGRDHYVDAISYGFFSEINDFLKQKEELKDWNKYEDKVSKFKLVYPPNYTLEKHTLQNPLGISYITINAPDLSVPIMEIVIYKKGESEGISNLVSTFYNNSGKEIEDGYTFRNIEIGPTDNYTTVTVIDGDQIRNFFNTITNLEMKEVSIPRDNLLNSEQKNVLKTMLKQLEFNN